MKSKYTNNKQPDRKSRRGDWVYGWTRNNGN